MLYLNPYVDMKYAGGGKEGGEVLLIICLGNRNVKLCVFVLFILAFFVFSFQNVFILHFFKNSWKTSPWAKRDPNTII